MGVLFVMDRVDVAHRITIAESKDFETPLTIWAASNDLQCTIS